MISSRLYRNSARLFGATLLFAVLGNTNATAATPLCDLSGPGPAYECRAMIDRILNETPVVRTPSEPEENSSIAIKASRGASQDHPGLHISNTGLGALAWALGHPKGAWKVVLPVQPDKAG